MNIRNSTVAFSVVLFFPLLAQAESQASGAENNVLANFFWTILPFLILGVVFWFFFVRRMRSVQSRSNDYISTQKQHNERVEQLLERIASAVEKNDKDGT